MFLNKLKIIFYFFIVLLFFSSPAIVFSQNTDTAYKKVIPLTRQKLVKLPNADAKNAVEIEDSIVGPVNISLGFGVKQEMKVQPPQYYGENNSAWYKFIIDYDTILTFDIVPFDSLDDYDFALFKCSDSVCIGDNDGEKFKIVRICFSMCVSKSGMTGLSKYSNRIAVGAGHGPAYVSAMNVKAGETYYLMVDYAEQYMNPKRPPAGFMIYFYNYSPRKKPIVLNNIFFETGKSVLQKESFTELDKLVFTLKKSQMVIEVRGHTDNEGDAKKNQLLSEERAKAVVDYLVSKKINKNRLFYKGFGSSNPIASNATKEGCQKNRRVEFIKVMY